ncbi:transporter [Anaerocolumna aminovalerica]|uniref:transporter n=1 Tax=Anaerocolumna aminovalerica TaxID=1527 RepID=UPI00248BE689|nr:transporter [Anaerocolumna aminovalerica]
MRRLSHTQYMKKNKGSKRLSKVGIVLFLVLILIFPSDTYIGAKKGLLLWFNTVLPTLLPFIIMSNLIIRLQITKPLSKLLYPFFHFIFKVSKGGCYPILIGFLSGIPVGAKSVGDLYSNGSIDEEEAQYLLSFCNNSSPMFIMGYIAISQLKMKELRGPLLFIIYISGIIAAFLYFRILGLHKRKIVNATEFGNSLIDNTESRFSFAVLDSAIMDGFEVITKVGGYIILFSIPAQIITTLGSPNNPAKLLSIGLIEITTGINQISMSSLDLTIKIVLITIITSLGGLSGLAQTKSVISNTRLSFGTYFKVKLIHAVIAFLMASFYVRMFL